MFNSNSIAIFIFLFFFTTFTIDSYCVYDTPDEAMAAHPGSNFELHENHWNLFDFTGLWQKRNIIFDEGGNFDWGNWKCTAPGTKCKRGDWATVWKAGLLVPGWTTDPLTGESIPPLPPEAGLWQRSYPSNFSNYNPSTGVYEN